MTLTMQDRIDLYRKAFPGFAPLYLMNGRIEGLWIMGQNYTVKTGYYGGYPHGYLKRVMAMFPDAKRVLHLFSGCVEKADPEHVTFDMNPDRKPDVVGDAEKLSEYFGPNAHQHATSPDGMLCRVCGNRLWPYCGHDTSFDLILADPPYSVEDCEHYGTPMVSRSKVVNECFKVLAPGGHLVWLDQVFPMFRKVETPLVGTIYCREELPKGMVQAGEIGMVKSTNHRVRAVFMFRKDQP